MTSPQQRSLRHPKRPTQDAITLFWGRPMGARRRCLLPVCLSPLGTPTTPAQLSDDDRSSHQTDLSARILAGSPLEGRQLLGQASALVGAAQGKAFVLESVEGQPSARAIKTSTPVYKAFGMNASGERPPYRPPPRHPPPRELVVAGR